MKLPSKRKKSRPPGEFIKIRRSDISEIINTLTLIQVSMDRIGSREDFTLEQMDRELGKYLRDVSAFKRLGKARYILSVANDSQIPKATVLRQEAKAESLPYWSDNS